MNKTGIIFIGLAVSLPTLTANATGDEGYSYSKLFEAGKTWNIEQKLVDVFTEDTTYLQKQVSINREWYEGDHLLTEVKCVNLQTNTSYPYSFLEEDRAIFKPDTEMAYHRMIDFNLKKGDPVPIEDGQILGLVERYCYIVNDEVTEIRGIKRRIVSIADEKDGTPFTYWIEGIGSVDDWTMLEYSIPICAPASSLRITSCYLNDQCIFTYEDLVEYINRSGIKSVSIEGINKPHLNYKNDSLMINGYTGDVSVEVYLIDGTLCMQDIISDGNSLSISSLNQGCYLARASFYDGTSASLKFVKK